LLKLDAKRRDDRRERRSDDAHSTADARAAATTAYDQMVTRISQAWQRSVPYSIPHGQEPDAAEELLSSPAPDPGDIRAVERRRLTERGAEAQRERDLAWRRYCDNLQSAYKTNPRAATEIERQGEQWRHGR